MCVLCSAVQIFNRLGHKVKCFHLPDYTPANTVAWARTNVGKLLCITWVHSSWNEIIINIWKKEQKYPSDWNISSNSKIIYLLLPLTMQFSSNGWMKGKMVCITFYKQIYTYWWKCNSLGFWIPPKNHGSPSLGGGNIPYTENRQFITPAVTSTTNQIPIDSASHTVQCTSIFLSTLQRTYFQVSLEKGWCS